MRDFLSVFSIGLFQNTLRTATPVVLAALGVLMTDHVGIMNIGMDGMMLCGAFFAVLGSCYLGGWLGGLVLALAVVGCTSLPRRLWEKRERAMTPALSDGLRTVWVAVVLLVSIAFLVGDSYNPFL